MSININKEMMEQDSFEFRADNKDEFLGALSAYNKDRKWYCSDDDYMETHPNAPELRAANLTFFSLEDMPLLVSAIKGKEFARQISGRTSPIKYHMAGDVSENAILDTMFSQDNADRSRTGSSLLCCIGHSDIYPVGMSALKGLHGKLGINMRGHDNLQQCSGKPLGDMADVYNNLADAAGGDGFTACTVHGKWRAFNGPRYAITDDLNIWEACEKTMKKYPLASFYAGYISHELTSWVIDLTEYKDTLFGQYANLFSNYSPVLLIETSNTRDSAVNLRPGLRISSSCVPLTQEVSRKHVCKGNYSERIENMKQEVAQAFDEVMPRFEDAAKDTVALQNVKLSYPTNALETALYILKFPMQESLSQIGMFTDIYGEKDADDNILFPNVTAYDVWLAICDTYTEAANSGNYTQKQLLDMTDGISRAIRMDWQRMDTPVAAAKWIKA